MFNLASVYEDPCGALERYSVLLKVNPLPATVYMMQIDVLNHLKHALTHYFSLTLNESYLQNSSLGTPYQKWANFLNQDFELFSFSVINLLRYTSRLLHETELNSKRWSDPSKDIRYKSHFYVSLTCELRNKNQSIGIIVQPNEMLKITSIRDFSKPAYPWRTIARGDYKSQTTAYFRIIQDEEENEIEEPISREEFDKSNSSLEIKNHNIHHREELDVVKLSALAEYRVLVEKHQAFQDACKKYYQSHEVIANFDNLIAT